MSMKKLLVLALAMASVTCAGALFTAPPGSTITLIANPEAIPADGGVSVLSAFVFERGGRAVPDGTNVMFFTNMGRVDPGVARTKDGIAHANFVSDSRSGTASVTAVSGGSAPAGPEGSSAPGGPITGNATATVQITIGAAQSLHVIVTADPSRITDSRSTHIFATVVDALGNPVQNIGVIFSVGASTTEFMDSQGHPIFTDTNGRAEDVLRTRRTTPGTVSVTATTLSGASGSVVVPILLQ